MQRELHIGLVVPSFSLSSTMQIPSISLLARGLSEHVLVTVLPLRNPPGSPDGHSGALNVVDIGGASMKFRVLIRRALQAIRIRHREMPFDVLHGYWLFEPGMVAAAAGRMLKVPVVVSIGGAELVALPALSYGGHRTRRGRALNRAVLAAADLVTGGSEYVLDQAGSVDPRGRSKLRFAPLPVRIPATRASDGNFYAQRDTLQLLQVGAYLAVKGQDLSIRAFASLAADVPASRLTMIGEDPYGRRRRLKMLASDLGVADQVTMLDRIPHSALADYYRGSDLLLMPSRHESQGMTVLEAAAHGLPTIGSNVGVVADLAPDAAIAVPTDDHSALAAPLRSLLTSRGERATLATAARRAVVESYAEEPAINRWISVYEEARRGR